MKKIILLAGCFIFATITFAQSNNQVQKGNNLRATSVTSTKSVGTERVSDYYQLEKKIMSWVKGRTIPASVPKHNVSQSKSDYALVLLDWAKNNENLLQDKFKAKVTDDAEYARMIVKAKEIK